jgi:hypothetical protein
MSKHTKRLSGIGFAICWLAAVWLRAQAPAAGVTFTATTANVAGAPDSIRIEVLRWSTDAERDKLMMAWNAKPETATPGGRGGARGGARGARGGAGRGGRGGAEEAAPQTPEAALTKALEDAPTVGYLWSSEVAGYALRYAGKLAGPDGRERIILITDRRLGVVNDLWKPTTPAALETDGFSVIELRVNAKGEGEGKISLTGKVAPDSAAKIVALENYDGLPVVLKDVKRRAGGHS